MGQSHTGINYKTFAKVSLNNEITTGVSIVICRNINHVEQQNNNKLHNR